MSPSWPRRCASACGRRVAQPRRAVTSGCAARSISSIRGIASPRSARGWSSRDGAAAGRGAAAGSSVAQARFGALAARIDGLSPLAVLGRGYVGDLGRRRERVSFATHRPSDPAIM